MKKLHKYELLVSLDLRNELLKSFKLKEIDRAGWINSGLKNVESVASHSWGVSYLALILCPTNLDKNKVLSMSIIHDLGEAIVGDITPEDKISKEDKHNLELSAINKLTNSSQIQGELIDLWLEYENKSTPEALFVKACDSLDMALQATIYDRDNVDFNPSEFIESALRKIDDECMRLLASETVNGNNPA